MKRPGFATRDELARWADTIGAGGELPRLVRRLVLETGKKLRELSFPAAEGSRVGDWDGTVRADEATAFIPEGLSGWELSVDRNAGRKADEDYEKRMSSPDGSPTTDCTYVAVSLRIWQKRKEWAATRFKEGRWKAVRALGLDELDAWIEDAPVTHAWISEQLGLEPYGLHTVDRWWTNWSTQTNPTMPSALMLAGRDDAVAELRQKLGSSPQTITINATSRDEVLAFIAAFALAEETAGSPAVLARTAVVDDVLTWRSLQMRTRPLVLVAASDGVIAETGGRQTVHHVIVPVTRASRADITLQPIDSNAAAKALTGSLSEKDADDVARLARLSLLAARRRLGVKRELLLPDWAKPPVERPVRRLLLANRWSAAHETDREVVARLVGSPYSEVADLVVKYSAGGDPLLTTVDAAVTVVSPYDAYLLLVGELTNDDLELFRQVVLDVLGATNPALELPADQRWQAAIMGKQRPHSSDLRAGVVNSLALLGSLGERAIQGSTATPTDWAAVAVRDLLKAANDAKEISLWASLDDVFPELAEAAPGALLDGITEGLQGDPPLLKAIFIDDKAAGLFAHHTHTGLLWALEICAWSPDHFGRAVDLLARLAEIDPGSERYINRPFNSLKEIFLPWHPQNSVDIARQLDVIDAMRERHTAIAWRLMLALLPEMQGAAHGTHPPSYQQWKPPEKPVLMRDYNAMVRAIAERVASDVGNDVRRWVEVIPKVDDLGPDLRKELLDKLAALAGGGTLTEDERAQIFEPLDDLVNRHREYAGEAAWALPATEVDAMKRVAERFRPTTPLIAHRWLFADHMPSIEGLRRHQEWEKYNAEIARMRREAIASIADKATWDELLGFVRQAKVPEAAGAALSDAAVGKFDAQIIALLDAEKWSPELVFARSYVAAEIAKDPQRADQLLADASLSPRQRARVLLAMWNREKEWELLESEKPDVVEAYWLDFPRFPGKTDARALAKVVRGLRQVGRVGAALDLLAMALPKEDDKELAELAAESLEHFLKHGGQDPEVNPASYDFVRLFEYMDRSLAEDRVATLEWSYLSALEHSNRNFALHKRMADSPDLFVDLVTRVYRPRNEKGDDDEEDEEAEKEAPEVDESTRAIAQNAYRLIDSWKSLPGLGADGKLDGEKLRTWIDRARSELLRLKRRGIGDDQIGKILAHSPGDPDGAWPAIAVRDVIESLQNKQLEDGFRVEIFNSRGVTSRGLDSGGDQERDLTTRYRGYSDKLADRWPRTAALLRRVADSYEHDARREDEDAERWRKGLEGPGSGPVAPATAEAEPILVPHFAYGSNMSTKRLEDRVGRVVQRGAASLDGFEIRFDKKSDDDTGKTNIAPAEGKVVWGVLFELTPDQLEALAKKEKGYRKQDVPLTASGQPKTATAFVAKKQTLGLRPTRKYLDYLIAGAIEHTLPGDYVEMLKNVEVADPESS